MPNDHILGPLNTTVVPPTNGCYTLIVEIDHDFEAARLYPSEDLLDILKAYDGGEIELAGTKMKVVISGPDDDRPVLEPEPTAELVA